MSYKMLRRLGAMEKKAERLRKRLSNPEKITCVSKRFGPVPLTHYKDGVWTFCKDISREMNISIECSFFFRGQKIGHRDKGIKIQMFPGDILRFTYSITLTL